MHHIDYLRCYGRRQVLRSVTAAAALFLSGCVRGGESFSDRLRAVEEHSGGRLGVHLWDAAKDLSAGYRSDERFGMCSTFKLPLAAVVLQEADEGRLSLDTIVSYGEEDMVFYAPVTEAHLDQGGMTIAALAEAAQTTSDNVAANLLLKQIGGPAGFTGILRSVGDSTTRLDRFEPEMNLVPAGEVRDTTTPRAMALTVGRFFSEALLSMESKTLLRSWMEATRTGSKRLRAGFPSGWSAGDKMGTAIADGMVNKYNDVAVVWRTTTDPIVVTAYFEADARYDGIRPEDEAVLSSVGALAAERIAM